MKRFLFFAILGLAFIAADCNREDEEPPVATTGLVTVKVVPVVNGEELTMAKLYKDNLNHDYWFATLKFYLSNIALQKEDGSTQPLADVAFFDFEPNRQGGELDATEAISVPAGTYTGVVFDAGVRQDLNSQDPAVFDNSHPLSIKNNMYWTWSTQYIFTKNEGYVIHNNDTSSWFVHTGTAELYQPGIEVDKPAIDIVQGETREVVLELDLDLLLSSPNVLDLSVDGQSHTTDNMALARAYQENFASSFR
jgi:hypothetical protein